MWKQTPQNTTIYRSKDNISNLKIKIKLNREESLLKDFQQSKNEGNLRDNREQTVCEATIAWQEKLFSSCEVELYKDLENCLTDVQKKYHARILEDTEVACGVYTYTEEDGFVPSGEESPEAVCMYVFAELDPDVMLFSAKWHPKEGVLVVSPDFSGRRYYLEVNNDYKQLYSYSVENVSKVKEVEYEEVVSLPQVPVWDECVAEQFDSPPKRAARFSCLFEIVDLERFEYDNIHIRYWMVASERVRLEEGELSGSTHTSQSVRGVWSFGHIFQVVLLCEEDFKFDSCLKIFFEVISVDSWERERLEGYAQIAIPVKRGTETAEVTAFKPKEDWQGALSRFLIGGRRKFDLERFCSSQEASHVLNRCGSHMQTTGCMRVKYQCLLQSGQDVVTRAKEKDGGLTLEHIMKSYREATRRLRAVALSGEQ